MKPAFYLLSLLIFSTVCAQTNSSHDLIWKDNGLAELKNTYFKQGQIQEVGGKVFLGENNKNVSRYFTYAKIAISKDQYVYGFLESVNDDEDLLLVSQAVFKTYIDGLHFYEARVSQTNETKLLAPLLTVFFSKSSSTVYLNKKHQMCLYEFLNTGPLSNIAKKPPFQARIKARINQDEGIFSIDKNPIVGFSVGGGKVSGIHGKKVLPDLLVHLDVRQAEPSYNESFHSIKLQLGTRSTLEYSNLTEGSQGLGIGPTVSVANSTPFSNKAISIGLRLSGGVDTPYRNISIELCPISAGSMRSILFPDMLENHYGIKKETKTYGYSPSAQLAFVVPILGEKESTAPTVFFKSLTEATLFRSGPFSEYSEEITAEEPRFSPNGYQLYTRNELAVSLSPFIIKAFFEYIQSGFDVPVGSDPEKRRNIMGKCSVIGVSGVYVFGTE